MENGPFMDDFPIKTSIYEGFSMAMLNNQMVQLEISWHTAISATEPCPVRKSHLPRLDWMSMG